jgi:hypothetical protein
MQLSQVPSGLLVNPNSQFEPHTPSPVIASFYTFLDPILQLYGHL